MKEINLFFLFLALTALALLIAGMYKPWTVLWWEDYQNRRKVLLIYGPLLVVALTVYLILESKT